MLWHIAHRYDTLANTTTFVQGDLQNATGVQPHTDLSASQMREKAFTADFGRAVSLGSPGNNNSFNMWDGVDWVNDAENAHWLARSGSEMRIATITPREFWQRTFGYVPPPSIAYAEGLLMAVRAETIRMRSWSFGNICWHILRMTSMSTQSMDTIWNDLRGKDILSRVCFREHNERLAVNPLLEVNLLDPRSHAPGLLCLGPVS